jgi:hypothetical protein
MLSIKGRVNGKVIPLNNYKYGEVFETTFHVWKPMKDTGRKKTPVPVSLCHHKSHTGYVEI